MDMRRTPPDLAERLTLAGVPLTRQRLAVARALLAQPCHLTADQILARVHEAAPEVSRATVYNTLRLFSDRGLVKELIVEAGRVVYDSNTEPHYHLYDADTGEVMDVPAGEVSLVGTPRLPQGLVLEAVDVVLRVRRA